MVYLHQGCRRKGVTLQLLWDKRMFVDYAGRAILPYDAGTGEVRAAQWFVTVLGASNYTYAEATTTDDKLLPVLFKMKSFSSQNLVHGQGVRQHPNSRYGLI